MLEFLTGLDKNERLPIWVISHQRAGSAPTLERMKTWERQDDINVLVRESQRDLYRKHYPMMRIKTAPDSIIGDCGSARQMAVRLAEFIHGGSVFMADDDVLRMQFLYEGQVASGANAGAPCSRRSGQAEMDEVPDLEERVVTGACVVALDAFRADDKAVIGGLIKQHMSFGAQLHETKYLINQGVTPRQAMIWNVERMEEMGIALDLEKFGVHGEDLGWMDATLAAGGDCFSLPSFTYDHWPEAVNIEKSMIRNAKNAARLHAEEWAALQTCPIKDYLRVKLDIIGNYEWGDVNWQKLNKIRGTKPIRIKWTDEILGDIL